MTLLAYKVNTLGEKIAMSNVLEHLKNCTISKKNAEKTTSHFSKSLHIGTIIHVGETIIHVAESETEETVLIVDVDDVGFYSGIKKDGTGLHLFEGDWDESEGLERVAQELKFADDESDKEYNIKKGDTGTAIPCIVVPKYWRLES
jgi:hypothetical protein